MYRTPVPGMPTVRVTRPEECTDTRAPVTPIDVEMPCGVTVIRTPGMSLNDFRAWNPIGYPPLRRVDHSPAIESFDAESLTALRLPAWPATRISERWGPTGVLDLIARALRITVTGNHETPWVRA